MGYHLVWFSPFLNGYTFLLYRTHVRNRAAELSFSQESRGARLQIVKVCAKTVNILKRKLKNRSITEQYLEHISKRHTFVM